MKRIVLSFLLALLALLCGPAIAAPACLPGVTTAEWFGSEPDVGITKNGVWIRWTCQSLTGTPMWSKVEYVGTLDELPKIGGRIQTIVKAADPLKSLQTAPNRFTILPLTDPSLAAIVADMRGTP